MLKLKKFLLLLLLLSLSFFPLPSLAAYDQSAAATYLQAHSSNPWSTMGLKALNASIIPSDYLKTVSGTNAIGYEAPILAITALGQDPKTFGSVDLVAKLKSFHQSNQLGNPTALNDDIFGILALISSGLPSSDSVISDSKNFLLSNQNSDGGWSYAVGATSDSNTTAAAIVALAADGMTSSDARVQSALNYLKTAQNSDGGFTYDPKSAYGTASDSSSTAWTVWALDALSISPASWSKNSNTPITYLASNQDQSGFFKFQTGSAEDSFSAVTTAYAVIALAGKTLPLAIYSGGSNIAQPTFAFRIEGSQNQICSGKTLGPTALDIVKNASISCGFTYHIKDTSFGPYLDQISSDVATGQSGWLYLVNDVSPDVGAADYQLKSDDEVLWYFGDFGWQPTKLSLSAGQVLSGQSATAQVQAFDGKNWSPLGAASISAGASTFNTDQNGNTQLSLPDGYYKVAAQKTGYIRSNQILLQVGQPSSAAISLSANVDAGQVQGTSTPPTTIAFTVDANSLDFGTLKPGQALSKQIIIKNTGSVNLHFEDSVSGDDLFINNLIINGATWQTFAADITAGQNQTQNIKLAVPAGYGGSSGAKTGQLIFWANAQ